jgi:hypothetical protein
MGAGTRLGKIAAKVELRNQQEKNEAQGQQADGETVPAHKNTTISIGKNRVTVNCSKRIVAAK